MKKLYRLILIILFILGAYSPAYAKVVEYKLTVNEQKVNISGKESTALSINNSIPGPIIKATVGDTLRIEVKNNLNTDTSIHWHGVLLPNNMDGVPYINTPPIHPGKLFVYEFKVRHSGTYWYHAHSALQEQQGVYGSIVFYPQHEVKDYDEEHVLVLSDWTDENPDRVLANIKQDPEYYALKKDSVQSWLKVLENGFKAVNIRINSAWTRMGPMDMSDIGYDAFLINGKKSSILSHAKAGKRVKLRIINAAASSYFVFEYSGGQMKVIEADGIKVDPFTTTKIRIAMAETYDVIINIPENKTYEFRASSEDGTGYATAHIGHGNLIAVPTYPKPNLVLMGMMSMDHSNMGGHTAGMQMEGNANDTSKHAGMKMNQTKTMNAMPVMNHSMHQGMQMEKKTAKLKKTNTSTKKQNNNASSMDHSAHKSMLKESKMNGMNMDMSSMGHSMESKAASSMMTMNMTPANVIQKLPHVDFLSNYKILKSPVITTLPKHNPSRAVTLRLTGSMERYVWTINDTPMYAADKIVIKKGENVKFILINETMMHHPIHLHGHFFRVLNGQGDYSPLKHTVNVAPFETVEIEFEANEEKDWIFHCHNLYHMKLGMGGVIHYQEDKDAKPDAQLMDHKDDHSSEHGNIWFNATELDGYSNFSNLSTKFMRNNDNIIIDSRHDYNGDHETEAIYKRYVSQFLGIYVGGNFKKEDDEITNTGIVGISYTLPLLLEGDLRLDTKGKLRFGLSNEHQLMDRVSFNWKWNTENEYTLGINYAITKQFYFAGNYDSKERFGIGLNIKF